MRAPISPKALLPLLQMGAAGLGLSLLGMLPAAAHGTAAAGMLGGAGHPLLGLDHLLLLLAVGTTSALAGPALLALAAGAAVAGALIGSFGGSLPGAELLAALVITALGAALLWQQRRQRHDQPGAVVLAAVLAAAVALHALLHGLESSGQASWWLGAAVSSCLVVGLTHLSISRLKPSLRQAIPAILMLLSAAMAALVLV